MNPTYSKLEDSDKNNQYNYDFENLLISESANKLIENIQGKSILELGCGKGIITKKILQNKNDVTVVDASEYFINQSKKNNPEANYIKSNWNDFQFDYNEYSDIVVFRALSCLEHPEELLKNIKNQIKGKPTIHILVTNTESIHRKLGENLKIDNTVATTKKAGQVGRVSHFNLDKLNQLLHRLDFTIQESIGIGLKPLPNSQMDKLDVNIQKAFSKMGSVDIKNAAELYLVATCIK